MNIHLLAILVLIALLPVSCKKGEAPEKQSVQNVNPWTTESVYNEVEQKLKEKPDDPDLWYHLADLQERDGQYKEAIESYKKAVQLKPDMGYAYFKIGTAYNHLDQPADAVAAFKKAIRYMPNFAVAYNNLAVAYAKLGKKTEEIRALKKAIRLRPDYATARFNLAVAYLKAGDKKAAMAEYRSLKKIDEGIADDLMKEIKKGEGGS